MLYLSREHTYCECKPTFPHLYIEVTSCNLEEKKPSNTMTKTLLSKPFTTPVRSPIVWLDNLGHSIIKALLHSELMVSVVLYNRLTKLQQYHLPWLASDEPSSPLVRLLFTSELSFCSCWAHYRHSFLVTQGQTHKSSRMPDSQSHDFQHSQQMVSNTQQQRFTETSTLDKKQISSSETLHTSITVVQSRVQFPRQHTS